MEVGALYVGGVVDGCLAKLAKCCSSSVAWMVPPLFASAAMEVSLLWRRFQALREASGLVSVGLMEGGSVAAEAPDVSPMRAEWMVLGDGADMAAGASNALSTRAG